MSEKIEECLWGTTFEGCVTIPRTSCCIAAATKNALRSQFV